MAFKIIPKIKVESIQDRSLDMGLMKKYYKQVQQPLIKKATPETPTDYFFCANFSGTDNLFVFGTQTTKYKTSFKAIGKGGDGFDKSGVSIGKCFVMEEDDKKILCIQHDSTKSKGKKELIMKSFRKMLRTSLKQFKEVRWMDKGAITAATGGGKVEVAGGGSTAGGGAEQAAPVVSKDEIEKRGKQLEQGIKKLKDDIIPRFKKKETDPKDADFLKALRKAASVWLAKLAQTDSKTAEKAASQQKQLEGALPKWKKLEARLAKSKTNGGGRKEIRDAIKLMNEKRAKIKALLKKVDLKSA
jgi:hypothetical protein